MNYRNEWLTACFCTTKAKEILVYFKHRNDPIRFTTAVLDEMKHEPNVTAICDADTGEIIYRPA